MAVNGAEFGGIIDPGETERTLAATNELWAKGFTVNEAENLLRLNDKLNAETAAKNTEDLSRLGVYREAVRRRIFNEGF